jgi:hypothetical protein
MRCRSVVAAKVAAAKMPTALPGAALLHPSSPIAAVYGDRS